VAVLPFANRSADPEDEYFADGLGDELLATLARIRGLRVAARTSSSQFKGTKDDLATIGRKLNVSSLLEGSVRKAGNRVRITVQLVNVADGYRVWSESYDRTLEDVFAVQDEIAQSVVKELRRTLLGEADDSDASREVRAEVAHAARGRSTNPEAQRLLLLGRHLNERRTEESLARAIEYLEQALALDPGFASAWAELANIYSRKSAFAFGLEERRGKPPGHTMPSSTRSPSLPTWPRPMRCSDGSASRSTSTGSVRTRPCVVPSSSSRRTRLPCAWPESSREPAGISPAARRSCARLSSGIRWPGPRCTTWGCCSSFSTAMPRRSTHSTTRSC
jgi:TolB-like protein